MVPPNEPLFLAENTEEAIGHAVKLILEAASDLCLAADLADEGTAVDFLINSAIRLRDLANFLSPDKPDWPVGGADIYDFHTRKKVN